MRQCAGLPICGNVRTLVFLCLEGLEDSWDVEKSGSRGKCGKWMQWVIAGLIGKARTSAWQLSIAQIGSIGESR